MGRRKQIYDAGLEYQDSMDEFQRYHTYPKAAFIDGAKWADESMIDKACKVYREHLIKFNPTLKEFPTALDEAVYIFRKQLEA